MAIYARRARLPLAEKLDSGTRSWDMLGTNLSVKVSTQKYPKQNSKAVVVIRVVLPCHGYVWYDKDNWVIQQSDGSWGTETERLLLMDSRDFNRVGIGVDDLIEAYMQVRVLFPTSVSVLWRAMTAWHIVVDPFFCC